MQFIVALIGVCITALLIYYIIILLKGDEK